ncbi:MAG TPA: hypothetical protein ENH13_00620 [Euryarchaeota archaeon]|nr:hypothetical protein BMS3Abin16_01661 [archaeon BMS3Abin16]HDH27613.1 hypothetical protein [Euryarchaeota archaeon]HDY74666.1 hypothetical protein [Euryarchaeota archaeon]
MTEEIQEIIETLNQVIKDNSVPRNIRRGAEEAKNILKDEKEDIKNRASSALYILEGITNDRNLPMHARTTLWNVAGSLETL